MEIIKMYHLNDLGHYKIINYKKYHLHYFYNIPNHEIFILSLRSINGDKYITFPNKLSLMIYEFSNYCVK